MRVELIPLGGGCILTARMAPETSWIGREIRTYKILSLLGTGGMGEVYRARDKRLGRDVAIKLLPASFATDPARRNRFEQEARALAALNHPNIGGIYGLEEVGNSCALVLELVDGVTLADTLQARPMPIDRALPAARQICEAIEAAHEKGIVHRDLKPANIKITPDGTAKVLDFGLAKALSVEGGAVSDAPTATVLDGVVGTPAYMSPEQARGETLDKRTDIWSFGCVFFEMLAGRRAFACDSMSETIAAVLGREPDWAALPPTVPSSIKRVLQRCLEKDPRRRLRDIGDARLEIDEAFAGGGASAVLAPVPARTRRDRLAWPVAFVLFVALILSIVIGSLLRPRMRSDSAPNFSRIVRLTSGPAREFGPAISPDGKWVAYLSNVGGVSDVWVKFVAGGEPANLTATSGLEITSGTAQGGLEISPDGTRIAVIARPRGSLEGFDTWEIPAPLPGVPHKLLDGGLGLRWSPDGRQIAFMRAGGLAGDALFVADADGTNRREIVKARDGMHNHWPAWSHDGYIYFIHTVSTVLANAEPAEIYRLDPRSGSMEPVVLTTRRAVFPLPMPDGTGLIYAANPASADLSLWWRPATGSRSQRLTTGVGEYAEPRISADGKTLVCTLYEIQQALYRIEVTPGRPARLTAITDGFGGDFEPSVAPNGDRMVFTSTRSGNRHVWTARIDGTDARPLTSGPSLDQHPAFSPDGQQIAFISDRGGRRAIWVIDPQGGAPRKLADVPVLDSTLSWSSNSREVLYTAGIGDFPGLWTVSVADGQIKRLPTPGSAAEPALAPTRDLIAYMWPSTSGRQLTRLGFIDATGNPVYASLPQPPGVGGFTNGIPAWTPDGRRLAVLSQGANAPSSIWLVEPDDPTPYRMLIEFPPGPRVRGMTWTRDGSALIIGKHETSSDIVLLDQGQ
jgi:eukaryotic-like serine/threonine-protein kinase